ncbi:MAG: WhiB family transcriptional regulator [Acidimicrobiales bacterium]
MALSDCSPNVNPESIFVAFASLLEGRPAWHADALCREDPHINFFPAQGERTEPAKSLCASCLVRAECLDFALERGEKYGVWAATSERQRRHMRKVVSTSGRGDREAA